jgi:hypothetical protein
MEPAIVEAYQRTIQKSIDQLDGETDPQRIAITSRAISTNALALEKMAKSALKEQQLEERV